MKQQKTKPVRIPLAVYKRLQDHAKHMDLAYGETLEHCLDILDKVHMQDVKYVVGGRIFNSVAVARGEAIISAIQAGVGPSFPEIVVTIGKDTGE